MSLNSDELVRYSRHLNLPEIGTAGQEQLKGARVLMVGIGGLGSPALLYLAAAGVGTLGLADFDCVEISNLQRQVLFNTEQIGQTKTAAARSRLLSLNPHLTIHTHQLEITADNVTQTIKDYDWILDGTDQFHTRYLVNDACVLLNKPLISAAIHRFEGQLFTYVPHLGPCYRCLFPIPPNEGAVPNCAQAGVLGVLPGVMGALQATETIKLITGIGEPLLGRLLTYDALALRFSEFKFSANDDCSACGPYPTVVTNSESSMSCGRDTIKSLSVVDLQRFLAQNPSDILLVDVREPCEFDAGHIQHAINIPLSELSLGALKTGHYNSIVFICRSGGRSAQACLWAQSQTQTMILNTQGGMLAWQQSVDPSMTVP